MTRARRVQLGMEIACVLYVSLYVTLLTSFSPRCCSASSSHLVHVSMSSWTCSIADPEQPQQRFIQAVKWYLSAFHAGRKSSVAKKPYNPILGETFKCHWEVPDYRPPATSSVSVHEFAFISMPRGREMRTLY